MSRGTDGEGSAHVVREYRGDSDIPTSLRIVRCVSEVADVPPTELPPLQRTVDPDALDALCPLDGSSDCTVSFRFAGVDVYVSEDGDIRVTQPRPGELGTD